jgi:hypothetical protein
MSLFDIDKSNNARISPSPNSNDEQKDRMAHNTMGTTYRSEGGETTGRVIFKNGLILTYDTDDRVSSVYGYIPALADYPVLIIAKSGFDVYEDILGLDRPTV